MKFTEKFIQAKLFDHYKQDHKYMYSNMYYFDDSYESDAIHFLENGHAWEFEIKVVHFDYVNDFDKVGKHEMLKQGINCANRFFYAAPFDVIKVEELPPYAGLIEVDVDKVRIKKQAPLLHKQTWNPALHFDRIYLKWRKYVDAEMTEILKAGEVKKTKKSFWKPKKRSSKKQLFPKQEKYLNTDSKE